MLRVCCMLHAVLGVVLHAVLHVACCVACSAEATVAGFPHAANTHPCNMQHSMQHTTIEHATCNILQCKGAGASANCCNRDGFSPLHVAAAHTVGLPALGRLLSLLLDCDCEVCLVPHAAYTFGRGLRTHGVLCCALWRLSLVIGGTAVHCAAGCDGRTSHRTQRRPQRDRLPWHEGCARE
jgi:hypothetical protein